MYVHESRKAEFKDLLMKKLDLFYGGSQNLEEETKQKVADEIGDVLIYLTNLSDQLDIDPVEAAHKKLEKAAKKYPIEKAKGKALKYHQL